MIVDARKREQRVDLLGFVNLFSMNLFSMK